MYEVGINTTKCSYEKCPRITDGGVTLHNINGVFPEIEKGEFMHLSCYIRHCVYKAIEERLSHPTRD